MSVLKNRPGLEPVKLSDHVKSYSVEEATKLELIPGDYGDENSSQTSVDHGSFPLSAPLLSKQHLANVCQFSTHIVRNTRNRASSDISFEKLAIGKIFRLGLDRLSELSCVGELRLTEN